MSPPMLPALRQPHLSLSPGVGGLDWKDVKPLMEKHLGHLSIPVYVYGTYHPGVQAEEKHYQAAENCGTVDIQCPLRLGQQEKIPAG